jgi:diaminopimelate decarboxylase
MPIPFEMIDWNSCTSSGQAFFIYSQEALQKRCDQMRKLFPGIELYYSVKSNPNLHLLRWMSSLVDGFDISSQGELNLLLKLGVAPNRITYSGPGKSDLAIQSANEKKLKALHIDSESELNYVTRLPRQMPLTLRLASSHPVATKLGFSKNEIGTILEKHSNQLFAGLHCYLGRESYSDDLMQETLNQMEHFFTQYPQSFISDPQCFIGPGMPLSFSKQNCPKTIQTNRRMSFEIGRTLVGPIGLYAAPVLAHKTTDAGRDILILEGGLQHLGSPFQSFRDKNMELKTWVIRDGKILKAPSTKSVSVYGSLCLWHDCLMPHLNVPSSVQRGDWLVFSDAGAYGLTAGVPYFIGQTLPREFGFTIDGKIFDFTNSKFKSYLDAII